MLELIFYSLIGGLFSLIGGLLLLWKREYAKKIEIYLLSFAAGAFLSISFLDVLPEALELVEEPHPILLTALGGFLFFFILERAIMTVFHKGHSKKGEHEHSDHTESLPALLISGDSLHNFIDGIVIALAFLIEPSLGLITAIAVAAHEVPQEIADFSILLNLGWSKTKVLTTNVLQSLASVPGALLGFYAGNLLEGYLPYLLAAASGIFLYISASSLVPEIHHKTGHHSFAKAVAPLFLSVIIIWYLIKLTHGE